jgi:hypothetical protein
MIRLDKEEKRTFTEIFGETPLYLLASFHEISGVSFYLLELQKKKKFAVACGRWTNGREDWILPSCDVDFTMYDTETAARLKFALAVQTYLLNGIIAQ